MSFVANISDGTGWTLSFSQLFQAQVIGQSNGVNQFVPITPRILPVLFSSRLLVVGASSQTAKSHWRCGGRLTPLFDCGATDFVQASFTPTFVPLNEGLLWFLPGLASAYRLRFEVPWWLEEASLQIYEYTGSLSTDPADFTKEWLLPS